MTLANELNSPSLTSTSFTDPSNPKQDYIEMPFDGVNGVQQRGEEITHKLRLEGSVTFDLLTPPCYIHPPPVRSLLKKITNSMGNVRAGSEVEVDGVESNVMRTLGPHVLHGQIARSMVKKTSKYSQEEMDDEYDEALRLCSCIFGSWNQSYIGAKKVNGEWFYTGDEYRQQ